MMMDESTEIEAFHTPPEAPVFTPTSAEFADPLAYISKIRSTLDQTGICKIRPPPEWQPPFAVDVENFRFVPRVQKINELEATTRVKLIFLNKLMKFWDLQGVILKVPTVGRKPLDFHKLHKVVQEEGGFNTVCADQKWKHIASERMNLPNITNKCYGTILRGHYERFLYPYDLFESGAATDPKVQALLAQQQAAKRSPNKKEMDVDYNINSEMKKLQYFGAGKKVALPSIKQEMDEDRKPDGKEGKGSSPPDRRLLRDRSKASYLESDICRICSLTDNEDEMLTCSSCDEVYHKYCLIPKVTGILKGDWRCPNCVAKEYKKPTEVFGFEQSQKEYTLAAFGAMADKFKENYFQKAVGDVSCEEVEKEFWRLTKCLTEDVTVQYGADIHALTNGSGFPTQPSEDLTEEDEQYIYSKWNLNNLPVASGSVLKYISGDVSGMKVPWCYVGMCFSSFCWHIEDHWSYSINFMHWGEPKTWYGVPSSHAESLETVMRSRAPELFEQSPDLLHHITTIMNPNSLMSQNIPVVRTDQRAGEFIVTAPRAFHAGFNQGYNFAEAVNFCPADWLKMGRLCISNYKKVKRYCVFSHEELICKMAADAESLDLILAVETHRELLAIVDQERKLRKNLLGYGVKKAEREAFELLPDDERQCSYCKTTCFLSAITCPCKPNKVACIEHIAQLCHCPSSRKCLRYRYTLDELPAMIRGLGKKVEGYELWSHNVKAVFGAKGKERVAYTELKQLYTEAKDNHYPENSLFKSVQRSVKDAEKYSCLVKEIVNRKARTRRSTELAIKSAARRLTISELDNLVSQLDSLVCVIKDAEQLEDLSKRAAKFQEDVTSLLSADSPDKEELKKLYNVGFNLDMDITELKDLQHAIARTEWVADVQEAMQSSKVSQQIKKASEEDEEDDVDLVTVEELKVLVDRGQELPVNPTVDEILHELEQTLKVSQSWEEKASICLQAKPRHTLSTIETILSECDHLKVYLPNIESLRDSVERALEWKRKATDLIQGQPQPTLPQLRSLIHRAATIPVKLDLVNEINSIIDQSEEWKAEAHAQFVKPDYTHTLLDVLLPRHTKQPAPKSNARRRKQKQAGGETSSQSITGSTEKLIDKKYSVEGMYEKSAEAELEMMQKLRLTNGASTESHVCQCGLDPIGSMFCCSLCKIWIHYSCSDFTEDSEYKSAERSYWLSSLSEENKFLCYKCMRSKRPKLDIILKLLMSLQKIPARLEEGEALQSLTERTIAWQDQAKEFISSPLYTQLNKKFDALRARKKFMEEHQDHYEESQLPDHNYGMSNPLVLKLEPAKPPAPNLPNVEPDSEFCTKIDDVMMEGHLLEVTVSEMSTLWTFSATLNEYKINKLQPPVEKKKPAVIVPAKPSRKSRLSVRSESDCGPTQEDVISSTTSSHGDGDQNSAGPSHGRKRQHKPPGHMIKSEGGDGEPGKVKRKRKKQIVIEVSDDEDDDQWGEYDEKCAAIEGCELPDDESIGWVQCEQCQLWFHFICIGVDPKELADADYYCFACESKGDTEATSDSELIQTVTADDIIVCNSDVDDDIILERPYGELAGVSDLDLGHQDAISVDFNSSQSEGSSQLSSASTRRFKPLKDMG